MDKNKIIKILVKGFEERLNESDEGIIYAIYGEYLIKEKELKEGVKTNEV